MIRTCTELMEKLREYLGEDISDEAIAFTEDMNDTFAEYERQLADVTDWESKYKALDEEWRKKYRDRFFDGGDIKDGAYIEDVNEVEEQEEEPPQTYDDLFEEESEEK